MSLISLQKITLLPDSTSGTGAGSSFSVERSKGWTFTIESASTSATVNVEAYVDGEWRAIHIEALTAAGNVMVRDDHGHYEKIRGNITAIANGTVGVHATGTTASL